ncbi:hypothetical protein Tco_0945974 [Tanacetum coccineum]
MVRLWWSQWVRPPPQRCGCAITARNHKPIRHPQPATAAATAGKAVAAAMVAAVAWEDGGTRLNGWRGWRSAAKIRRKKPPEMFSGGGD